MWLQHDHPCLSRRGSLHIASSGRPAVRAAYGGLSSPCLPRRVVEGTKAPREEEESTGIDSGLKSIKIDSMSGAASSEVTQVAAATSSQDPEVGLAAVAALRGLVEVLEALQVENARAKGWSWQQIAARLGVTKQAVHHKYGGRRFGFRR
jgi:hypothetical protein